MIARASGCVSFHPLARRRRASSAAVKMVSRSISVGVSRMLASLSLGARQGEHRIEQHVRASLDVRGRRELLWAVTAALAARHENHSDVGDARHDLRIVHGTTGHPHSRESTADDDPVEEILKRWSKRDRLASGHLTEREFQSAARRDLLEIRRQFRPLPDQSLEVAEVDAEPDLAGNDIAGAGTADRKSTRLNSSHVRISYAVFCLKKKNH